MESNTSLGVQELSSILGVSNHLIYKIIKDKNLDIIVQGNRKNLPPRSVKEIFESRGYKYSPNCKPVVINIFGMKGGIGKTSLATAIAEGASRLGFRVLAIDLDMQGNLTQSFSKKKQGQPVLKHVIKEENTLNEIILNVHEYLDIIPSSLENSNIEGILSGTAINYVGYFNNLLSALMKNYDLIVTDCPPSINKITTCATCFADLNLIPVNADIDSYDGVVMSVSEIKLLEKTFSDMNLSIDYKIVFNKYDAREKLSLVIMGEIAKHEHLNKNLLPVVVRTDTSFKNTKASGKYIFDLKKSSAKDDCYSLISEITSITKLRKAETEEKVGELETI